MDAKERYFCRRFDVVIPAMIDEAEGRDELRSLEAERGFIEKAGTESARAQVDRVCAEALGEVDRIEQELLAEKLKFSGPLWAQFFECYRGGMVPLTDRRWVAKQAEGLAEIEGIRKLIRFAYQHQIDRLDLGKLEPEVMDASLRRDDLADLAKQIAKTKKKVAAAQEVLAPLREGGQDSLPDLLARYVGSQQKAGNNPVKPEEMNATSPAHGGCTTATHPLAEVVFMDDDDPRMPAWEKLRAFLQKRRAA